MSCPQTDVIQVEYQNPHAQNKLLLPVQIICNTTDEIIKQNIIENSEKHLEWLKSEPENALPAIIVGGGASIEDEIDNIRALKEAGGVIFAANAASQWLRKQGLSVDYQCIADAKEESLTLIDPEAKQHIISSQAHPKTMDSVADPVVWHLSIADIETLFPVERVKKGGYALLGGGSAVGNSILCVAYAKGFRDLHVFGLDSSHKDGRSHAYRQNMNVVIPTIEVKWFDREFTSSIAMKAQAEKFQFTAKHLKDVGCTIRVYGDGLLQTMYNTDYSDLSEREKYQLMWQYDLYREVSPGESLAEAFLHIVKPEGLIIDFGCGTGRASVKFAEAGHSVMLIDFADNCRDEEALSLPFIQWDLTKRGISVESVYGYCTDVMEHLPTKDVGAVIDNIMSVSEKVFFQISTVNDHFGTAIESHLHLTVKPHDWWLGRFEIRGLKVEFDKDNGNASLFYVTNPDRRATCQ